VLDQVEDTGCIERSGTSAGESVLAYGRLTATVDIVPTDQPSTPLEVGPDGWYEDWPGWAKESVKDSPEVDDLRRKTWAEMLPPPQEATPQMRSYIRYMQLTHNGRRTPSSPVCNECGDHMSDEQISNYEAALGRPPGPDRWV
jgi:hypothetical protein